jgi:hypothetical protein
VDLWKNKPAQLGGLEHLTTDPEIKGSNPAVPRENGGEINVFVAKWFLRKPCQMWVKFKYSFGEN